MHKLNFEINIFSNYYSESLWLVSTILNFLCGLQLQTIMESTDNFQLLFLSSVTRSCLPSSCVKLRSYYNSHLLTIANKFNLKLPKNVTNRTATCPFCYFPWSHNTASIKLDANKNIKNKKPNVENKVRKDADDTTQQRNKLVVKCNVCNQKSLFSLLKKFKKTISNKEIHIDVKKPKKKRKKDKTCGLKKSVINQVKQKTELQNDDNKQILSVNKKVTFSNKYLIPKEDDNNAHKVGKSSKSSNGASTKTHKNSLNLKNKNLFTNPFAPKIQDKLLKKNQQKLQKLRQSIQSEKIVKNTLKDFLSLVSK